MSRIVEGFDQIPLASALRLGGAGREGGGGGKARGREEAVGFPRNCNRMAGAGRESLTILGESIVDAWTILNDVAGEFSFSCFSMFLESGIRNLENPEGSLRSFRVIQSLFFSCLYFLYWILMELKLFRDIPESLMKFLRILES